jgi:hypothetical protein
MWTDRYKLFVGGEQKMKKKVICSVLLILAVTATTTLAEPQQWRVTDGGNDHWYDVIVVPGGITWTDAKDAADARAGSWHLATITSDAENTFVHNLFANTNSAIGPWIGAYHYYYGFLWDNGETFSYSNWCRDEPSGYDSYVHFSQSASCWNDGPDSDPYDQPSAYIIETFDQNQPPVLDPIGHRSVGEGATLTFTISATDPNGDRLIYSVGNLPPGAVYYVRTQTFSWKTASGDAGNYQVAFTVADSGDPPMSDAEIVTITVGDVNRPPELSAIDNRSVDLDEPLEFVVTAFDSDNQNLSFSAANLPDGASFDRTSRIFQWTPSDADNDVGNHQVTFTVTDDGAPPLSDSKDVTITVGDVNRPPVIGLIGNKVVEAGQLLTFMVTATDPDNDPIEFSAQGLSQGAFFDKASQLFYWAPTSDDIGVNIVRFRVEDSGTPPESNEVFIDIEVTGDNEAAEAEAVAEAEAEVETQDEQPAAITVIKGGSGGKGCFIRSLGN